jgi:hypothetical protein
MPCLPLTYYLCYLWGLTGMFPVTLNLLRMTDTKPQPYLDVCGINTRIHRQLCCIFGIDSCCQLLRHLAAADALRHAGWVGELWSLHVLLNAQVYCCLQYRGLVAAAAAAAKGAVHCKAGPWAVGGGNRSCEGGCSILLPACYIAHTDDI